MAEEVLVSGTDAGSTGPGAGVPRPRDHEQEQEQADETVRREQGLADIDHGTKSQAKRLEDAPTRRRRRLAKCRARRLHSAIGFALASLPRLSTGGGGAWTSREPSA